MSADEASLRPDDPLTRLKGIGPRTAEAFEAEGVCSVSDLLVHFPRRYEDRTRVTPLDSSIESGDRILVRGRVTSVRLRRIPRRRLHIVDGLVDDECGQLKVVWFNQRWLGKRLEGEPEFYLYGQLREARGGGLEMVNPEIEKAEDEAERIVPVYPRLGKWGGRRLRGLIETMPTGSRPVFRSTAGESPNTLRSPGVCFHHPRTPSTEPARGRGRSGETPRCTQQSSVTVSPAIGFRRVAGIRLRDGCSPPGTFDPEGSSNSSLQKRHRDRNLTASLQTHACAGPCFERDRPRSRARSSYGTSGPGRRGFGEDGGRGPGHAVGPRKRISGGIHGADRTACRTTRANAR